MLNKAKDSNNNEDNTVILIPIGLMFGSVIGMAIGLIIGAISHTDNYGIFVMFGNSIGCAIGSAIGALIIVIIKSRHK